MWTLKMKNEAIDIYTGCPILIYKCIIYETIRHLKSVSSAFSYLFWESILVCLLFILSRAYEGCYYFLKNIITIK